MTTKKKTKKTKKFKVTVKDEATTQAPAVATTTQASADATTQAPAASAEGTLSAVALSTTTPVVGQTVTAVLTPANPADVASYAWYANEDVIAGETTKTLKITTAYLTKKIKVVVTNKDGKTFESAASEAVTEDKSSDVTISVADALQGDGSVLYDAKTTFRVSYGKSFGDPVKVQWFCNEAVASTRSLDGGNLEFTWTPGDKTFLGKIYCEVTNKDGVVKKSNELVLTDKEYAAKLSNFTITDESSQIAFAAEDNKSVVTVKVNKGYAGTFYLFKSDVTEFKAENAIESFAVTGKETDGTLSEKAALAAGAKIGQVADDKTVTYMYPVKSSIVRGASYLLVFDQANITIDNIGGKDLNKSELATVPYVTTAQKIAITQLANGKNMKATVYSDAAATKVAEFIDGSNYGSVTFYDNTASDDATKFNQVGAVVSTATKGVFESSIAATNTRKYAYATYNVAKGICSKDAISVKSNVVAMAGNPATSITCAKGKADADLKVTFVSLESAGTLYVYRDGLGDSAKSGENEFDATKSSTYIKSVAVTPGTGEVNVEGAVNKADTYGAAFVPADTTKYNTQHAATVDIDAVAKAYKLTTKSGQIIKADGTSSLDLTAIDQWGGDFEIKSTDNNLIKTLKACKEAYAPFKSHADDVVNNGDLAIHPYGGKLYLQQSDTANLDEAFAVKLGVVDQYFTAVCTKAGGAETAEWTFAITDVEPRFDGAGDSSTDYSISEEFTRFSKASGTTTNLKFETYSLDQVGERRAITGTPAVAMAGPSNNLTVAVATDGTVTLSEVSKSAATDAGTYTYGYKDTRDAKFVGITVKVGAATTNDPSDATSLRDACITSVDVTVYNQQASSLSATTASSGSVIQVYDQFGVKYEGNLSVTVGNETTTKGDTAAADGVLGIDITTGAGEGTVEFTEPTNNATNYTVKVYGVAVATPVTSSTPVIGTVSYTHA